MAGLIRGRSSSKPLQRGRLVRPLADGDIAPDGVRSRAGCALFKTEQKRGTDNLRFANAPSGLYHRGGAGKRLTDSMSLVAPR